MKAKKLENSQAVLRGENRTANTCASPALSANQLTKLGHVSILPAKWADA